MSVSTMSARFGILVSLGLVAGCSSIGGGSLSSDATRSGLSGVTGNVVNASLDDERNGTVSDASVGLVAYVSGLDLDDGQAVALAGIRNNATVGSPVLSGVATYNTRYQYTGIDGVFRSSTFISGTQFESNERSVTLTADFGAGALTGSTSDIDVNGTISGSQVAGTVDVNYGAIIVGTGSLTTNLNGVIGNTGVIATFDGHDANTTIAGGMVGTRN